MESEQDEERLDDEPKRSHQILSHLSEGQIPRLAWARLDAHAGRSCWTADLDKLSDAALH
jgi:hypothetical protein